MTLVVVLVEPAGPLNVGSVARLCANYDIKELRLVSPRCDPSDSEAVRMAVHGDAVLSDATIFPSLLEAVADCQQIAASCGRIDHGDMPLQSPEELAPWVQRGRTQGLRTALVFGREDRGLSNEELLVSQRIVQLHTGDLYPSLNLSHAVAVVLHELERERRLHSKSGSPAQSAPLSEIQASATELDDCLRDAEALLLEVGFLLEHTARARMAKVKGLVQRALIRSEEVALFRGMVRQLRWAARRNRP
ncbi:MAG: rRNA methyltransferase [Synechococcus sp. NP17]|nr:rRNA methyltransferase [Synechococcus sp. NP17]